MLLGLTACGADPSTTASGEGAVVAGDPGDLEDPATAPAQTPSDRQVGAPGTSGTGGEDPGSRGGAVPTPDGPDAEPGREAPAGPAPPEEIPGVSGVPRLTTPPGNPGGPGGFQRLPEALESPVVAPEIPGVAPPVRPPERVAVDRLEQALRAELALRPDQAPALERELSGRDVEDALAALRDYDWQSPEAERRYDEALAVLSAG